MPNVLFHVAPRYTPGSPAQVDRATCERVGEPLDSLGLPLNAKEGDCRFSHVLHAWYGFMGGAWKPVDAWETVDGLLRAIRSERWLVAAHNDYHLGGEFFTFYLFTKDGRAVKGEGRSDAEALHDVLARIRE